MPLPPHIEQAIAEGQAKNTERLEAERVKQATAYNLALIEAEHRKQAAEAEALVWFNEELPTIIRDTTSCGGNHARIGEGLFGPREKLCQEAGFTVYAQDRPNYTYHSGSIVGYTAEWFISW